MSIKRIFVVVLGLAAMASATVPSAQSSEPDYGSAPPVSVDVSEDGSRFVVTSAGTAPSPGIASVQPMWTGYFTWEAVFGDAIVSRAWKNSAIGTVTILVRAPTNCKPNDLKIWIQKRDFPYTQSEKKTIQCGIANYPYWPNTDSIYYRFVIDSESNTGGPFSTSGTVWYP